MPTASERQALVFLTAVALMGGGVRVWQSRQFEQRFGVAPHPESATGEAVDDQLSAVDGARSSRKGKRGKSTPSKPQIVDVDIATSEQLEKLPRIGASLAQRIVANRDSFGTFGSIEALGRVRGIGVAMRGSLAPLITFSATPSSYQPQHATPKAPPKKAAKARKSSPKTPDEKPRPKWGK